MIPKRVWATRDRGSDLVAVWETEPDWSEEYKDWLGHDPEPLDYLYLLEFEEKYGYTIAEGLAVEMECHYRNLRIKEGGK